MNSANNFNDAYIIHKQSPKILKLSLKKSSINSKARLKHLLSYDVLVVITQSGDIC